MISKEDIKKLADLARIEVKEEELASLRGEIDSILDYVKLIQQFHPDETESRDEVEEGSGIINVMREDAEPTEPGTHSKELIAEFPDAEKNYLKVKKIL